MKKPLIATAMLTVALPLFGQSLPTSPAPSKPGALTRSPADPYRNLFQPPEVSSVPSSVTPKAQVVCGMTVIPADPSVDPTMVLPPKNDGVKYTIRAVPPPICTPAR